MILSNNERSAGALLRKARAFCMATDTDAVARRASATALVIRLTSAGLAYLAQVVFARLMGQYEYGVFAYTWVWFLVFSAVARTVETKCRLRSKARLNGAG